MRVDKLLWCLRYFKTRSLATKACKDGKVKIGQDKIKPSREIYEGDTLVVRKDQIDYELLIIEVPKSRLGAKLVDLHRKDITSKEALEGLALRKASQNYYRDKGTGRPTKKDRRDLEDYIQDDDFTDTDEPKFFTE